MAVYIGTKEEFKRHFGGTLRNIVNIMTKEEKTLIDNICEYCGKKSTLEAAHIRGVERAKIIDLILDEEFKNSGGDYYNVDVDKFILLYKGLHHPLRKNFHFLCRDCHVKYDKGEIYIPEETAEERLLEVKGVEQQPCIVQEDDLVPPKTIVPKPYNPTSFPDTVVVPNLTSPKKEPTNVCVDDYKRKPNEAIQDWVKRLFSKLYAEGFLTEYILKELQNEIYCNQTFGIAYPLLESNDRKIKDSCGHNRYWVNYKLGGKYFMCSQWWKDSFSLYEQKINSWLLQVLK